MSKLPTGIDSCVFVEQTDLSLRKEADVTITETIPREETAQRPTTPLPWPPREAAERATPPPPPQPEEAPTEIIIPHGEYYRNGQLQIVIAGLDENNVRDFALEAAHSSLESQLAGRGLRGIVSSVVKGNLLRNHYLLKEAARAKQAIVRSNNVLYFHGAQAQCYSESTLRRFAQRNEALIEQDAGEAREVIGVLDREPEKQAFRRLAVGMIKDYVNGDHSIQNPEQFARKFRALLQEHRGGKLFKEYFGNGSVHIDNLWQVARNAKEIARQWEPIVKDAHLNTLLQNAVITVGRAKIGPRSSFAKNRVERLAQKLEGKTFLHETTVVGGVTLAAAIGGLAVQRTLGAMTAAVAPGALAGLWAGRREGHILKDERVKFLRDQALGRDAPLTGRRKAMSLRGYETVRSVDLTAEMRQFYNDRSQRIYIENDTKLRDALKLITRVDAYVEVSNKKGVDLLAATCTANYQIERDIMRFTLEQFKTSLRLWLRDADPAALKRDFGIQHSDIQQLKNFSPDAFAKLLEVASLQRTNVEQSVAEADAAFKRYKRRRVAGVAGAVALMGTTFGLAAQEGVAQLSDTYQGVFEQGAGGKRQTWLAALLHDRQHQAAPVGQATQNVSLMGGPSMQVPSSLQVEAGDGVFSITPPDGKTLSNLAYERNGQLSADSLARLKAAGFDVSALSNESQTTETVAKTLSAKDFIAQNPKLAPKSTIDFFYTNNTAHVDGTETMLQYGGNNGVDAKGNYIIRAGNMSGQTATQGSNQLNVSQAARSGKLWVGITASKDTAGHTMMFKMNANGQLTIPKGSPAGSLFEPSKKGGYPVFKGHQLQLFENGGTNKKGEVVMRPLATEIGTNKASFTTTTEVVKDAGSTSYVINYAASTTPVAASQQPALVAIPPILPLYWRRTLSAAKSAPVEIEAPEPTVKPPVPVQPFQRSTRRASTSDAPLPPGAKPEPSNQAQALYRRLINSRVPIQEAQQRLRQALRRKSGIKDEDIVFSENGTSVFVLKDTRIPRHISI